MEGIKKILLVLGGFVGGIVAFCMLIKKVLGVIAKSDFMMMAIKDSWIDLFIKLLYVTGTDEFIDRKLREDGYIRIRYHQYARREGMRKTVNYWD